VGSIDQGTSSTRFMIFDKSGSVISKHQEQHNQIYYTDKPGYSEHNPIEIWEKTRLCVEQAMKKANLKAHDLAAVGITNQRETTIVWNKNTGIPYHNAIVWNDLRTTSKCDDLAKDGGKDKYRDNTGLPLAPYFSASKLNYLLETVDGLREDAIKGDALFGTIDTWLLWNLTSGAVHATDVTNASRTLLMNIKSLSWDDHMLSEFSIPKNMLPTIRPSSAELGKVSRSSLPVIEGVPITGIVGDQQGALFGQGCFSLGEAKCTYGTGAFLLMNTEAYVVPSRFGLLTTVGYQIGEAGVPGSRLCYALEGSVAYAGLLIQWLRDNLGLVSSAKECEEFASTVRDNGGVYFVPAFSGLYAPYW
jgi:glycerol kinase